jgi:alkanesulfonate monooxygenase SsuD/methylene tetrahydromethanopterin reductase-like flavin-dependent oxidoreductase (luciferase family)
MLPPIAASILAMTHRAPILLSASILPLHDPIRIAEQIAVIDNAFPGRLWTVLGAGYRVDEFEMAGVDHARRGKILEEQVAAMLQAWTGEPFEWEGRTVRVTPVPATKPQMAGLSAEVPPRRRGRLRLPMMPMNTDPVLHTAYRRRTASVSPVGS